MDISHVISACKKKDSKAQRVLYETYAPLMMGVCMRYCSDNEMAEDLLHDGFIQVFTHISMYKGEGSFEGWMRRIFVNMALTNYRKQQQQQRFMDDYRYEVEETEHADFSDELDIDPLPHEKVLELIRELPDGYRTVFNLYVFEDMSHREIANKLDIQEAASRSQYFRAKRLLKQKIESYLQQKQD